MTKIRRVSPSVMWNISQTPFAMGYADHKTDTIYILNGLDKATEGSILAHEKAHIERGESGAFAQFLPAIISGVTSLVGGGMQASAQRDAAAQGAQAADPFGQYRKPFADLLLNLYGMYSKPGKVTGGKETSRGKWTDALIDMFRPGAVGSHLGSFNPFRGGWQSSGMSFADQFDPENLFGWNPTTYSPRTFYNQGE